MVAESETASAKDEVDERMKSKRSVVCTCQSSSNS